MRILAISNYYPPFHAGGYGLLCYSILERLRKRGHFVQVLTRKMAAAASVDAEVGASQVDVRRVLRFPRERNPLQFIMESALNRRCVNRSLERYKPDIAYIFGVDGLGLETIRPCFKDTTPTVAMLGDTWYSQAFADLGRFDRWVRFASVPGQSVKARCKRLTGLSVSTLLRARTSGHPETFDRVHGISNFLIKRLEQAGVALKHPALLTPVPLLDAFFDDHTSHGECIQVSNAPVRFLMVSRLDLEKGSDDAVRALAYAVRRHRRVTLTLCGFANPRTVNVIKRLIVDLNVSALVTWAVAPDTASLIRLYRSHDVFLFPSRVTEGFGIVCAEAMACGLPVIASNSGGQLDLVRHGETGLVFQAGDHAILGEYLVTCADEPDRIKTYGRKALALVQRHRPDRVLDLIEADLEACIACGRGNR